MLKLWESLENLMPILIISMQNTARDALHGTGFHAFTNFKLNMSSISPQKKTARRNTDLYYIVHLGVQYSLWRIFYKDPCQNGFSLGIIWVTGQSDDYFIEIDKWKFNLYKLDG